MNSKIRAVLGAAMMFGGLAASAAPAAVYENVGTASSPVIDAVTFLNRGSFNVAGGSQPYETQNTLNFTNFSGASITGNGMRFGLTDEDGLRHRASSFYNAGTVRMGDSFGGFFLGGLIIGGFSSSSWLLVDATNVVNRSGLGVSSTGLLQIKGDSVRLARSGLRAGEDPTQPISEGFVFEPNYTNDEGVEDVYAGVGVNNALDPATPGPYQLAVLTGNPAASGLHEVLLPDLRTNRVNIRASTGFALTNAVSETNWVVQAIIVNTNFTDPQFRVATRWGTPRIGDVQGAQMAMVQYTYEDVDTITGEPYTNYLYVLDSLGALTNAVFYTNGIYLRPSSYVITRVTPEEWDSGVGTNAAFGAALLSSPDFASPSVTNVYAAYSATVGINSRQSLVGLPTTGTGIPELTHPTNLPGRIEIEAGVLDQNLTRYRSEGLLSLKADQLLSAPPYKLDSPIVRLDVGSRQGPLLVSNVVSTTVRRFIGQINCWSAAWTNQTFTTAPDPNDATLTVTNTIDIRFHVLIVQDNFQTIIPVETLSFKGAATEAAIWDQLTVSEEFSIDAPKIEIHSGISVGGNEITPETFPSVESLTLNGGLFTATGLQLGSSERPIPSMVSRGALFGSTITLHAAALENSGSVESSVGDVLFATDELKLEGGTVSAAANLRVEAEDFKAQMASFETGTGGFGSLLFDVTDRLTDGGPTSSNFWLVTDGIQVVRRPGEGDLLGTSVFSFLNRFREGIHVWPAEDRGAIPAGFENNLALGTLTLDGTLFTLFTFAGPDSVNPYALYVDYLDLTNAAVDVEFSLNIATNFTLYFADSSAPPESLDGALGGRLRWVQAQAGARSGVPVTLSNGQTVRVNRALMASAVIDSDGDGIPNAADPAPFESASLRLGVRMLAGTPNQAEVTWMGTPGGRYRVEFSTALTGGEWKTLTTCEQTEPGVMKVCDTLNHEGEQRFYRVVAER